jgi:hypothetical protein
MYRVGAFHGFVATRVDDGDAGALGGTRDGGELTLLGASGSVGGLLRAVSGSPCAPVAVLVVRPYLVGRERKYSAGIEEQNAARSYPLDRISSDCHTARLALRPGWEKAFHGR